MAATYRAEQIRAAVRTALATVTVANGYSFTLAAVGDAELDEGKLDSPSAVIRDVDGASSAKSARTGEGTIAYAVDLFAKTGEVVTLDRAVTDLRNALESPTSAIRALPNTRFAIVVTWDFVEGTELWRSANHRARLRVEVDYVYEFGSA